MPIYDLKCSNKAGLEPAILDWYSHCDDRPAVHKC